MIKRNKPYLAFESGEARKEGENWIIPKDKVRVLYDGRYCAISGFFYAVVEGKYSVLAEKRGKGTPDYQGYWCCPCGFLEGDEDSWEGIQRETREECGVDIPIKKIRQVEVETEPILCNNGNVTIRHTAFLGRRRSEWLEIEGAGGEKDEVDEIAWIPVSRIDEYKWAFNHGTIIKKYASPRWMQRILEFWYR